jgi:hypothetical protein
MYLEIRVMSGQALLDVSTNLIIQANIVVASNTERSRQREE